RRRAGRLPPSPRRTAARPGQSASHAAARAPHPCRRRRSGLREGDVPARPRRRAAPPCPGRCPVNPRTDTAMVTLTADAAASQALVTAAARVERGEPAPFAEYDLFHGMAGIGALLLARSPGSDVLAGILRYMVSLIVPRRDDGVEVPGWWVAHDPDEVLPTPG